MQSIGVEQGGRCCISHAKSAKRNLAFVRVESVASCNLPESLDAWREKVVAAASRDEARQPGDGRRCARFQEAIRHSTTVISGQGTSSQPGLAQKLPTVDPIRLNDFKLLLDTGVRGDKEQSSPLTIVRSVFFQERTTVADPAPQNAMPPDLVTPADVARVSSANMRAERTFSSKRIIGGVAKGV